MHSVMRSVAISLLTWCLTAGGAFCADAVSLRGDIEVNGPAVTLGDFFANAGDAGARAVAPAPPPGKVAQFSPQFVEALARAAGLTWSAPPDLRAIEVRARGAAPGGSRVSAADAIIKRGDLVTITYAAPGINLSTRARAASDAREGQIVRLINPASNRTIDAIATGPGAARASDN
jgi:flagella basal body P-ring formation protein FlgA